eukprot:IDg13804t1
MENEIYLRFSEGSGQMTETEKPELGITTTLPFYEVYGESIKARLGGAEALHQLAHSQTAYPLEKTNNTDIATLTMAEPGDRNAHKLATGEIVDIYGGTWDGPEAWICMNITKADRAPNFVEYFPVWRYLEGLDYTLCALYSTNGFLPGGIGLLLS